jgi:VWFA-related protein
MTRRPGAVIGSCVAVLAIALRAQVPSSGHPQFAAGATAITVDVVVRDKHGKPVTDLKKGDFELLEDGVRQEIGAMTLVAAAAPAEAPATAGTVVPPADVGPNFSSAETGDGAGTTPATLPAPTFVALVFDRLSPEARALACKGAQAYLELNRANDFAGVFLADLSLVTIEPYTNDHQKLAAALKDVASRATSRFDREATTGGLSQMYGDKDASVPVTASAESAGRTFDTGGGSQRTSAYENLMAAVQAPGMFERMLRDEQGHATTDALRAVIAGLGTLPGRKSVVFFAEGIAIPDNVLPKFQSVVAEANRGNISIYTVDSEGLRVHSSQAETARRINGAGDMGLQIAADGSHNNPMLYDLGDTLRRDPRTSLSLLADQTGGFLIENTNDLAAGFRRIDLDRRFHYVLTYSPKNTDFNGEWRSIAIKVPTRDVQVRARSGYLAIHTSNTVPLVGHETRALADLDRMPPPAQIPISAGAFVFPQATGDSRVAILLSTTGRALTFEPTSTGYRTDFTLLARIRDARGEVVRKASQPYRIVGATADRNRAQQGDILFYRQPTLPPGSYTLDVAADDAIAKRGGVSHIGLTVPQQTAGVRVSDLVIVGRTEKLAPGELSDDNVLVVSGVQLYPNLGEPIRKSVDRTLSFYVMILPNGSTPTATLTLGQNGRTLATLPVTLDAADAGGRIQQVGQIPLASFAPGAYEVTFTVTGGATPITRSTTVTVAE